MHSLFYFEVFTVHKALTGAIHSEFVIWMSSSVLIFFFSILVRTISFGWKSGWFLVSGSIQRCGLPALYPQKSGRFPALCGIFMRAWRNTNIFLFFFFISSLFYPSCSRMNECRLLNLPRFLIRFQLDYEILIIEVLKAINLGWKFLSWFQALKLT